MTSSTIPRLGLPRITRVQLHAFSLYSLDPNVSLILDKGVTCLAGANGIGKSTFLSTINYALTGVVPDPKREFLSASAYWLRAKEYTANFFDGRIAEDDREAAAVSIDFVIRNRKYFLKRHLFEAGTISELRIVENNIETYDASAFSPDQNDANYRDHICEAIGLNAFEQFVLMQHFLFTFDESRHLIFWDRAVSSALLYICFGGDPQDASKADRLNREMEKAGSRGRNLQYQASTLSKRIETLEQSVNSPADATAEVEAATARYEAFNTALAKAVADSEEADALANEAELRFMQASSAVAALRSSYTNAFEQFMNGTASPERHPLIASTITECRCPICQNVGSTVAVAIRTKLAAGQCPLCTASFSHSDGLAADRSAALSALDASLAEGKRILDTALVAKNRLSVSSTQKREAVRACRSAMNEFEEANRDSLAVIRGRLALLDGPLAQTLQALRTARTDQFAQRDLAYSERDEHREELKGLQRSLERKYLQAEATFVPLFKRLAQSFLGVDLDISLITTQPTGLNLQIEMRGNARRKESQLSESQRFFVDIALRMALAQYVSDSTSPAGLFIDTPEGSLDIAYEDRAGGMFADFVKSGHAIIMTANINSSKLLTTLARSCGADSMAIIQMTHWTELSDVQRGAEQLFRDAFADIEFALSAPTGVNDVS